jgi:putative two-component system response regulator
MSEGQPAIERVLVVDDDPQIRRMLALLMSREGFECDVAATAEEARAALRRAAPQLVLLDVDLPGESGLSLARELAASRSAPPVIMVSGHDDAEVADIALEAGAYGFITKPFKRNEISIAISDARRRHRRTAEEHTVRARLEDRVVERTAVAHDALEQLRVAQEETVSRLSRAIEYRDPETGAHIERMSHYCALLAPRFDLDPDAMRVASRLHDVGKIAIPDAILLKAGPLNPEERAEMERHAAIGQRLLRGSRSVLLDLAATIAWTHHERFDGSGYPRGLKGDEIPIEGRVAGVADVFDALISHRVYRTAHSFDEAIAMVSDGRGTHFDPAIVDAFLEELDAVRVIIERFDEEPPAIPEAAAEAPPGTLMTLQEAAAAVGVAPGRLRRWADEGRIEAVRTAGGHRRFPRDAVARLATERGTRPVVKPVDAPSGPLPALAERLRAQGPVLVALAAASLYRGGTPGWFAAEEAGPATAEWLADLVQSAQSGRYAAALEATDAYMRAAYLQATSLLERHSFLERLGEAALRALARAEAPRAELTATRRLFAALQQAQLDGRQ